MKKLLFSLMALALCATVLMSCNKDDDDNTPSFIASLTCNTDNGAFNGTAIAKSSNGQSGDAESTGSKINILNLVKGDSKTTVYGLDTKTKAFMSVTFKGGKGSTGTFTGGINATQALIDYLQGGSIQDAISGAVDSFIIYKASSSTENTDAKGFWFSVNSNVNITLNAGFINGTFTAKMMNQSGDSFTISNGNISCLGL